MFYGIYKNVSANNVIKKLILPIFFIKKTGDYDSKVQIDINRVDTVFLIGQK